ncbi:hydrogenase iron-sulfur subunit [Chloroflexota bacterium]
MTARIENDFKPVVTIFHCINTFTEVEALNLSNDSCKIRSVKLACSSMVKDVFLLRAFEVGADAVVVFACPEGECCYISGNIRAKKRVERVRGLLDEIGLGGRRLLFFNVSAGDTDAVKQNLNDTLEVLKQLGPNPAA